MSLGRVLITGGGGQLASDFEALLAADGAVRALPRTELDIADAPSLRRALDDFGPDTVLNCAAFHNLDVCEQEPDRAWEVNVRAVRDLAVECAQRDARLVHFSTNYVFDGARAEPYREEDLPAPGSVYALTKLAGEHAALAYAGDALVVRSAGLYGLHGSRSKGGNFVQRMLARAREQGSLKVVADQRLSPTFTADLAPAVLTALGAGARGILHLTNAEDCSWHEFTVAIMENAGLDVPVEPVSTTRPPGGVDRPLNGVLANGVAKRLGLAPMRPWRDALDDYMAQAGLAGG